MALALRDDVRLICRWQVHSEPRLISQVVNVNHPVCLHAARRRFRLINSKNHCDCASQCLKMRYTSITCPARAVCVANFLTPKRSAVFHQRSTANTDLPASYVTCP